MINDHSHARTIDPNREIPRADETPTKQARARGWQAVRISVAANYSGPTITAYHAISTRALVTLKKSGYTIRHPEMQMLLALHPYVMGDIHDHGIISVEEFLREWHISRSQGKIQGALHGLIQRGYCDLFDQRKNGTRYIGITPLGAKVLEVYYRKCEELFARVVFRRTQVHYREKPQRFQKVDKEHVGNLYTTGMTTRNRHLYDWNKYYNADGTIKP